MHTVNQKKYIDSYNTGKKMIDVHAVNKTKKAHRFLQYGRKKLIDVHIVNPKKQRKYTDFYNTEEKIDCCARC